MNGEGSPYERKIANLFEFRADLGHGNFWPKLPSRIRTDFVLLPALMVLFNILKFCLPHATSNDSNILAIVLRCIERHFKMHPKEAYDCKIKNMCDPSHGHVLTGFFFGFF